ncbi:MAG: TspO/MBR family protein [Patescibacteria group bacterium]
MTNFIKLTISLLITFTAAGIGSAATTPAIPSWYQSLNKPAFTPPSWLFGPAWTILYILTAVAFYLIWTKTNFETHKTAFIVFFAQLILNALWSIIFFGLKQPFFALIEIAVLWTAILFTLIKFYQVNKTAGLLLIPYLLWVTFATALNFAIWQLN